MTGMEVTFSLFGFLVAMQLFTVGLIWRTNNRTNRRFDTINPLRFRRFDAINNRINTTNGKIDAVSNRIDASAGELRVAHRAFATEVRAEFAQLRSELRTHEKRLDRIDQSLAQIEGRSAVKA